MSAPRGNCFNPAGRPKGAKSLKTKQWEYLVEYCLNDGLDKFINELGTLKGKEYVGAFSNIIEYFKPKLSRIDGNIVNDEKKLPIPILVTLVEPKDDVSTV